MGILLLLLIGGAFTAGWFYLGHLEKRRRERVIALAKELGLELNWQLPDEDQTRFRPFEISSKGRNQRTAMTLVADNGQTRISLFDYSFVTGSGKHQTTNNLTVAMCRDARLQSPALKVEPASFLSRMGTLVGYQDIDISEDPEFSKAFLVRGEEEEAIRRFLTADRRATIMQQPKQHVAILGDTMILVRRHKKLDEQQVKPFLAEALQMVNVMISDQVG
jgi:hypothetical protein